MRGLARTDFEAHLLLKQRFFAFRADAWTCISFGGHFPPGSAEICDGTS